MKSLIILFSVLHKLFLIFSLVAMALTPFYWQFTVQEVLIVVPLTFLLITVFSVYFDQKIVQWRQLVANNPVLKKQRCNYKFCVFSSIH